MIYQKRFTLLQNSVYPLSFDTSYKMYRPCMTKHEPFQIVMSKIICAEWEFKGLKGKFSSGIEGALATKSNYHFKWKQLS